MGFDRGFATTDQKEDAVTTLARLGEGRIVVGGKSDLDVMDLAALPISDATQEALDDKIGILDGVFGVGVRRIIASPNPNYPLVDGDLLILIETDSYFTDFSDYPTEQAPDDWTSQYSAFDSATVEEDVEADGGKVLRLVAESDARRVLTWDDVSPDGLSEGSVEIVWKWRTLPDERPGVHGGVIVSGGIGTETYLNGGRIQTNNTTMRMHSHRNGNAQVLDDLFRSFSAETWYISRFRKDGPLLYLREWEAGDPEPSAWDLEADTSGLVSKPDGPVGVGTFGTGTVDIDFVGVNVGGGVAPTEAE